MQPSPHSTIVNRPGTVSAQVTVGISLYNYAGCIGETLETVRHQTLEPFDLIVVDDASTDRSLDTARQWFDTHQDRFNRALLVSHQQNSGLSASRNTAVSLAATPYFFALDADNLLYPRCLARCLEAIADTDAAFAYPLIEKFGSKAGIMGNEVWDPKTLARGNYIDAMAMIDRKAIDTVGGYTIMPHGWEDFDLWCKFVEHDYWGVLVPEILARYRSHETSMLNTVTNRDENLQQLIEDMQQRHPWLELQRTPVPSP